mmetsp:Transcript_2599/g.3678  ORF Transcript_2599/g.3678 Transcript_2599/m.3678 type:complete len:144 (+) Transcript_2599:2231-2662(+)
MLYLQESNTHWLLCCIDFREGKIQVFDSMAGSFKIQQHEDKVKQVLEYLECMHQKFYGKALLSKWQVRSPIMQDYPKQHNSIDCGIFIILYAACLAVRRKFDFGGNITELYRLWMCEEMVADGERITKSSRMGDAKLGCSGHV